MDDSPPTKTPKCVDYEVCVICQTRSLNKDYTNYVQTPSATSVEKLITVADLRSTYGESHQFGSLNNRLQGLSADQLLANGVSYHKQCYKELTHKHAVDTAKSRFDKGATIGDVASIRQKKIGRPSSGKTAMSPSPTTTRTSRKQYFDKKQCVFCQEDTMAKLHDVSTENMGSQLKMVGEETCNETLKIRLSNIVCSSDPLAAVAEDIKYHLQCLIEAKRETEKSMKPQTTSIIYGQLISDMEILDIVEAELNDPNSEDILNMNDIKQTYVHLLEANSITVPVNSRYKPYLKQLILDNIHDVHFNRPPEKTKPEQVLTTKSKESLIASACNTIDTKDDLKVLMKATKILRRNINKSIPWEFNGAFGNYEPPKLLNCFCKHLIQGTGRVKSTCREESVHQSASVLAQHIVSSYKSDRQVSYQPKSSGTSFQQRIETPLTVGLALDVHRRTRSRAIVEQLAKLNLAVTYNKVLEIETAIANAVLKRTNSIDGICHPSWLVKDACVWFALDNIDFLESTPSGMDTLHGTAIAVYQAASPDKPQVAPPIEIDRSSTAQTLHDPVPNKILTCEKPEHKNLKIECKMDTSKPISKLNRKTDMAWVIGCLAFEDSTIEVTNNAPGTWGAFNSLLSCSNCKTNVALLPPLIRSPPTDFSTLFTGLMRARAITTCVMGNEAITVMTLDMQLYNMAMKLWVAREDIRKKFLFRPGELHVVFSALAALGKYVEGSGIDQAWVEAGLYSPTTVTQVINGKHMYRALEAHTVTLIALYCLYFQSFLTTEPTEKEFLKEVSDDLGAAFQNDITKSIDEQTELNDTVTKVITMFESRNTIQLLEEFEANANKIQRFVLSYMRQFETILLFVRSTRQRDLQLHMESTQSLIKYFFAHDHQNYARLLPLYVSTMQETEREHPEVWEELMKGSFCVTKGLAGFTSIAPDHGIEQENRTLKVIGGIVGITQNEKSLDKFFLIAPELSSILHEFTNEFNVSNKDLKTQHHEITGGKLHRMMNNATTLSSVFREHGDPFAVDEDNDEVYNLLTKEVMNENVTLEIIARDAIGQTMFEEFVSQRLTEGTLSVWDKMKKRKLGTFKTTSATMPVRSEDKLIKIEEERGLLQRFVVVSRSRPELNSKDCIGTYEFGIVPRSLFASDGSLLLAYDKSKVVHHIEKLLITDPQTTLDQSGDICAPSTQTNAQSDFVEISNSADTESENTHVDPNAEIPTSRQKVIVIDGMALVNTVSKGETINTGNDFAQTYINMLANIAEGYDEVRLVFDRYVKNSLKSQMRKKRTKGKSTYYHFGDNTSLRNITLKELLANTNTKAELTEYLANKCLSHSNSPHNRLKKFIVTAGTESKGNIDIPPLLITHSQEEADTLLLLHAITIDKTAELVIDSPDTDVFVLMIHMYPDLPLATYFLTGRGPHRRRIALHPVYTVLGQKRASAIVGFHAFTGSDVSGRFAGRSKEMCVKVFMSCDDQILDTLATLGVVDPSPEICSQLERFVCLLYRSTTYTKVNELRWYLYSNRAAEGESLPPTTGSLTLHIRRAHHIAMIWRKAGESNPSLPPATDCGWNFDEAKSMFVPVWCLNPPAPDAIMKLIKCGCKRGCRHNCSCRKNTIPCTELCGCVDYGCSNTVTIDTQFVGDHGDDSDEERHYGPSE